jgi:hypothetical protein
MPFTGPLISVRYTAIPLLPPGYPSPNHQLSYLPRRAMLALSGPLFDSNYAAALHAQLLLHVFALSTAVSVS